MADGEHTWTERVLVVRSESYRQVQQAGLERRLQRATVQLLALTPAPGRGKRQIQDANALVTAADAILQPQAVEGLLTYAYERQEQRANEVSGPWARWPRPAATRNRHGALPDDGGQPPSRGDRRPASDLGLAGVRHRTPRPHN